MPRLRFSPLWAILVLAGVLLTTPALAANRRLTIVNNSGYADTQIYILVWGKNVPDDGKPRHLNLKTGAFPLCTTKDNTVVLPNQSDKYCKYYVTLSQIKQANGTYSFLFPQVTSARLYISLKKPVYLHINPGTPPGVREPSVTNPSDPNYHTEFDKFEWTYDSAGLHANITCVDFFCLPLKFEMKAGATSVGKMGFACSQADVVQALEANPLLKNLKTAYRFYSPATDNAAVSFPKDYFNKYINYCWSHYKNTTLTIKGVVLGASFTASGRVNDAGQLVLKDTGNHESHTIKKPSSHEVFACNGTFTPVGTPKTPPYERDGFVKDEIASALNRTVMHLGFSQWGTVKNFYQRNGLPADTYKTNIYSNALHQKAIGHKIYGYAWDDKYDQESYLSSPTGTSLIVTINDCKSAAEPIVPFHHLLLDDEED